MDPQEQIAMHYHAAEPDKIIERIKRKEKKVLSDYYEEERLRLMWSKDDFFRPITDQYFPTIDERFEQVVVKAWNFGISVYPILVTEYQFDNETWVKFDSREKSISQKFGSLAVWKDTQNLYFSFYKRGQIFHEEEYNLGLVKNTYTNTIQSICTKDTLDLWIKCCHNDMYADEAVNFPLYLPDDWESIWKCTHKTRLTTFFE